MFFISVAQAVNIIGYEIWKTCLEADNKSAPDSWLHPRDGERLARREELENLLSRLEQKLDEKHYQSNQGRKVIAFRNIRNVVQRVRRT